MSIRKVDMHKFMDLVVYQKALKFTKTVRELVKIFPKDEMYVLSTQFKRAADSIVLNITEGSGSTSKKEFSQFLGYSIRSGFECIGCLDIALGNEFINEEIYIQNISIVNENNLNYSTSQLLKY